MIKNPSIIAGLVSTTILLLSYYTISLLDLWALGPPKLQVIFYFLIILASTAMLILGIRGKMTLSKKAAKSRMSICVCVTLIIAVISGSDFLRLTTLAFMPRAIFNYPDAEVTATVTPPLYLQKETFSKNLIATNSRNDEIGPVYEGSVLDVHVKNLKWAPTLVLSDGNEFIFDEMVDGSFKVTAKIDQQISWSIKQGTYIVGSWPLIIIDDEEPEIKRFVVEDHENEKGYLAFNVDVKDDKKIMRASLEIINSDGKPSDLHLLSIREVKSYNNIFYVDFTGSELAGGEVDIRISVEDEAGQISTAILSQIYIPERKYNHEIASNLMSLYQALGEANQDLRSLARRINALGLLPDKEGLPAVYYMAMRSAYWRLVDPTDKNDKEVARDLLWDIAQKIENNDLSTTENNLLFSLDELTLSLHQMKPISVIREDLKVSDRFFRDYINIAGKTVSKKYSLDIDISALRKLYSYILAFSDQEKYHNASMIVDFMRKGLVQNDDLILSKGGLGNYFALSESRQIIDNLIAIQRTLLSSSYNEQMKDKLFKNNKSIEPSDKTVGQKHSQIILQTKIGDAFKLLGEKISFAGDNSGFLIQNASELVDDILDNMRNSKTNQVTQSQSELIAIMSNLKRVLNKPISSSIELQNIMKEINSQPVL
ncbi:MAG: DUF4175 family protein [Emcibacteraceae bacterium]|nr:DUF4175 family protein [Emcibacteraceae bacterium]